MRIGGEYVRRLLAAVELSMSWAMIQDGGKYVMMHFVLYNNKFLP